jgi:peptidoglycan/LPS O-acetylase OafA/YrhL
VLEPPLEVPPPRTRLDAILGAFSPSTNLKKLFIPSKDQFASLNGVRALGLAWVICGHVVASGPNFRVSVEKNPGLRWALCAHYAIDLFFVLSGFLMSALIIKEIDRTGHCSIARFYSRRALRILPAYFLVILLAVMARAQNWERAWANVLYVNNLLPFDSQFIFWAWSLAIEEQFYIVLPLLLPWVIRTPRRAWLSFGGALVVAVLVRYGLVIAYQPPLDFAVVPRPQEFMDLLYTKAHTRFGPLVLGVAAAYGLYRSRLAEILRNNPWLTRACTFGSALALIAPPALDWPIDLPPYQFTPATSEGVQVACIVLGRLVFGVGFAGMLLLLLVTPGRVAGISKFFGLRIWQPLAQLCYSGYLVHVFVIHAIAHLWPYAAEMTQQSLLLRGIVVNGATFLIAAFIYLLVERPFMNLRELEKPGVARISPASGS